MFFPTLQTVCLNVNAKHNRPLMDRKECMGFLLIKSEERPTDFTDFTDFKSKGKSGAVRGLAGVRAWGG